MIPRKVLKKVVASVSSTSNKFAKYSTKNGKADRIADFQDSIWSEFTPLANKYGAVNLGQGFPDYQCDEFVLKALEKRCHEKSHQYARAYGDLTLVTKLAEFYGQKQYHNRAIDPMKEVLVTNGASGALFSAISSLINPGDEVILIEPFYDTYPTNLKLVGAKPVFVPLREPTNTGNRKPTSQDWYLDEQELRKAITKKTKAIVFNNPHNPTGKVFSRKEVEMIAKIALDNDLYVFSDEVYEFLVFGKDANGNRLKHERIATLDGMHERTLTIGSAGKTFSNTGWKIGWILGPSNLVYNAYMVNQYTVFSVNTPAQKAVAECIEKIPEINYIETIQNRLEQRSNSLMKILEDNQLPVITPGAGYFVLANIEKVKFEQETGPLSGEVGRDYEFCRWLPKSIGVAAIPPSSFMTKDNRHLMEKYARFCFCKEQSTIDSAKDKLAKLRSFMHD